MHLFPYITILLTASAVYLPLPPRVDPCLEDVMDTEMVTGDGPTADGTAGIGAEFESPFFYFVNPKCSDDNTNAAKREVVDGRKGTNWYLSADTGSLQKLKAEYILDGVNIKVGSGDGEKAGKAVADDLIGWHPWTGDGPNYVDISNNNCNPWRIDGPNKKSKPENLPWAPQVTTPMPLEALYSLMKEQQAIDLSPGRNILDGFPARGDHLDLVTQEHFKSYPNGIEGSKVTDDVLGFCSLVLSYAKAASMSLQPDQSPKLYLTFMPRTEFNTIYKQVKSKIPGDLFNLFNILACYTLDKKEAKPELVVDTAYCKGPTSEPVPNDKFGALSYTNIAPVPDATVNIKDWIQGIGKEDPSPDALSKFDESIDKSIGGLGTKTEKMFNSQRSVPLFEFRDLDYLETLGIEKFMKDVDSTIQRLHEDFADAPEKRKRDVPANCTLPHAPAESSATTPTPVVVAPVDPPSKPSCVPNPTNSVKDAHEGETKKAAKYFCDEYASNTNAQAPINIAQTIIAGTKAEGRSTVDIAYLYPPSMVNQDDVYDIKLTSVDKCIPTNGFNLASPVKDTQCADIFHSAWKNCNNQGRGGDITAGCLVYSIKTKY